MRKDMKDRLRSPWAWVPTLYFAEGLPYFAVMTLAVIMYQNLGLSDAEIAFYTSWLYLPWAIKPVWSPFVDLVKTKRFWVVSMQSLMAAAFAGIAFFLPTDFFLQVTLAFFWLLAFGSATHDIAADGYYMIALTSGQQSFFVGIRNTFYRCASIFGQGVLVMLAGLLASGDIFPSVGGNIPLAWGLVFYLLAAIFLGLSLYHFFVLPRAERETGAAKPSAGLLMREFALTIVSFFRKKHAGTMFFFILTYRLGESQLAKITPLFVLADRSQSGLGLTTTQVGMVYGTVGAIALLAGGIIAGVLISRGGLRRWIIPMALAINVPDVLYVVLAWLQWSNLWIVTSFVAVEQLGYGIGFAAYMLYLIHIADGEHKTAHYAIATGFMALGMMIPGMFAGYIEKLLGGYTAFFLWVCLCTIPGIIAAVIVRRQIPPLFGKKQ